MESLVQSILAGRPGTFGVEEKVQVLAWATVAFRVTVPPPELTSVGATLLLSILGAAFVEAPACPSAASP